VGNVQPSRLVQRLDDVGGRPGLRVPATEIDERLAAEPRVLGDPPEQPAKVLLWKSLDPRRPPSHRAIVLPHCWPTIRVA
jgi:hypothetical protein